LVNLAENDVNRPRLLNVLASLNNVASGRRAGGTVSHTWFDDQVARCFLNPIKPNLYHTCSGAFAGRESFVSLQL